MFIALSRIDIEQQLSAVEAAHTHASVTIREIERAIRQTADIERLSDLHDAWATAREEFQAARTHRTELEELLSQ